MQSLTQQRGALSLLWCAILMALLSVAALLALFSLRYERNLPAELWSRVKSAAPVADAVQRTQAALSTAQSATVRRCTVGGKVLYSNLDCDPKNKGGKAVKLHLTQGVEAPKAPPAAAAPERFDDNLAGRAPAMPAQAR